MTKWDKIFRIVVVLLLSANLAVSSIVCVRLVGKAPAEDKVEDIEINGESVPITDFLIAHLKEYTSTEEFADREKRFAAVSDAPKKPFTVTRAIELKADRLGQSDMSIHYLLVKADWWHTTADGLTDGNILIIVNYDTGEVLDEYMADESWLEDAESIDYWNYIMLTGALRGSGYDGGAIVTDSETRTELSASEIAKINQAIQK